MLLRIINSFQQSLKTVIKNNEKISPIYHQNPDNYLKRTKAKIFLITSSTLDLLTSALIFRIICSLVLLSRCFQLIPLKTFYDKYIGLSKLTGQKNQERCLVGVDQVTKFS